MNREKRRIQSAFDGLTLEMEMMIPEKVKGIVQISHGMAEHKERYEQFMEYLAGYGCMSVIHDHRGHGKSVNDTRELGFFYTEDTQAMVEDLHQITVGIKKEYPDKPVYLFSHSMGTLVARNYIKKYDADISKLIMCGPPTKNPFVGLGIVLAKSSQKRKGKMHRNEFLHSLAFKESVSHWLTTDQREVELYQQDPLCGYIFTNNGFLHLFTLMKDAYSKDGWKGNNPQLPIFLIAGSDDPVIQSPKKFRALSSFLQSRGYENIESKIYSGKKHELLNEVGREEVYRDVLAFLEKTF